MSESYKEVDSTMIKLLGCSNWPRSKGISTDAFLATYVNARKF